MPIQNTNRIVCTTTNIIYRRYRDYVLIPIINRFIPLMIIFVFGLLAYNNIQQLAYRTVPIIRRELDKQLTTMVLVQGVFTLLSILPYFIIYSISSYTNLTNNPTNAAILTLANEFGTNLYFLYFAVSLFF